MHSALGRVVIRFVMLNLFLTAQVLLLFIPALTEAVVSVHKPQQCMWVGTNASSLVQTKIILIIAPLFVITYLIIINNTLNIFPLIINYGVIAKLFRLVHSITCIYMYAYMYVCLCICGLQVSIYGSAGSGR